MGSLVRVIGSLAPSRFFSPASRIYIAPFSGRTMVVSHPVLTNVSFHEKRIHSTDTDDPGMDDIIVDFEKNSDEEEGGFDNPDGWQGPAWSPKFEPRYWS